MKRKLLVVYVLVAFVLLCTNVYAMVTADLSLVADKPTIKPGDEVVVTVELKNSSAPVSSIEGYINIDENVLESISANMIVANADGKMEVKSNNTVTHELTHAFNPAANGADYDVIFNTSDSATNGNDVFFVMDLRTDITADSEIMKLKYKVKEGVQDSTIGNAVKLDCIVAYSATNNEKSDELNATLNIVVSSQEPENTNTNNTDTNDTNTNNTNTNTNNTNTNNTNTNNTNTNNTNTNTNNTNTNNTNTNKNTNNTNTNTNNTNKNNTNTNTNTNANKADNTVSGTRIPAAGLRTVIIPLVIFMILAYVSYTKYLSYKDV